MPDKKAYSYLFFYTIHILFSLKDSVTAFNNYVLPTDEHDGAAYAL